MFLIGISSIGLSQQTTLVTAGSSWKYLDNGSNQGTAWRAKTITETSWKVGNAELGYGEADEATVVSYGSSSTTKYITTYFRKTFTIADASLFANYTLNVKRDDGVAVYVNGIEVYRDNLPAGASSTTLATAVASDDGKTFQTKTLPLGTFVTGSNTIAVEIHQNAANSSDISFDLGLVGNITAPVATQQKHIRWGSTKNPLEGLTISWTNATAATTDQIKWGYTTGYEIGTFSNTSRSGYGSTINKFYSYTFPGVVTASSTIYYSLYDSVSGTWSAQKTYTTAPALNTNTFSFAAIGDSRSNVAVWNTISTLASTKNPAFVVFNGDIVATGNSNSQWDDWFNNGTNLINNKLIFHAQGNHDVASFSYYQNIFDLPKNNVPATELYYSIDYGEVIFICLNSETPGDIAQSTWLKNTLIANSSKKWKIISFHKPFYTLGAHQGEMDAYFNTWFKYFDDYGVDLILTGHDHMYERFKPINRNVSTTNPVANYGSLTGEGRCQIVCGGAGAPLYAVGSSSLLQSFKSDYHFVIFDVTNTTLCDKVYNSANTIIDQFCISKSYLAKNAKDADAPKEIFYPIKLYPNPVKDAFKVDYSSPIIGDVNIKIYDINGKLIATEKTTKSNTEFTYQYNASSLTKGVYVFEIEMENQKDSSIMIKE